MHIAILTFEGFNELDSLIALGVLNRIRRPGWRVSLCCPTAEVTSMNGVTVGAQSDLEEARSAEADIVGSGMKTRDIVRDAALMDRLALQPGRQLIGAQCSGTLVLARLGLLTDVPACTDLITKPWVQEAGGGDVAAWVIARTEGREAAAAALHYVAPVGEKEAYVAQAMNHIAPFLPD
jgi:transcriptional regulator GlxA family with amidase domain